MILRIKEFSTRGAGKTLLPDVFSWLWFYFQEYTFFSPKAKKKERRQFSEGKHHSKPGRKSFASISHYLEPICSNFKTHLFWYSSSSLSKSQSSLLKLAPFHEAWTQPLHHHMGRASHKLQVGKYKGGLQWGVEQGQHLVLHGCSWHHLLKACVKGAVFALEKLLPTMLVPVVAPDALDVAGGEFTEFAVKHGFGFLLSASSSPRKRHRANTAVVPCQGSWLIVVQLLLNIWGLWIWWICEEMGKMTRGTENAVEVRHLKTPDIRFLFTLQLY